MKNRSILTALPFLFLACGSPGVTNDDANDAAGTGNDYQEVAKEVSGTWMLTTDYNYDEPCNYLASTYVRDLFEPGATTDIATVDHPTGCEFRWGKNSVGVFFGGTKPHQSIYHAEYIFDKLYQPASVQKGAYGNPGERTNQKPSLFGPESEGTVSERPSITGAGPRRDTSAVNDSSTTVTNITPAAAKFTEPAKNTATGVAVPNVGDKAVWEPGKRTLHVLWNNNIINVSVNTADKPEVMLDRAITIARVIVDELSDRYDQH